MSKKTLSIRLRPAVRAWVDAQAARLELSASATVDQLLFDLTQGPPVAAPQRAGTAPARSDSINPKPPAGPAPLKPHEVDLAVRIVTRRWLVGIDGKGELNEQLPSEKKKLPHKQATVRTWFEDGPDTAWDHYEGLCMEGALQPDDPSLEHDDHGLFALLMREATAEPKHGAAKPEEKALRQLCRQAWQYHQSRRGEE